MPEMRRSHVLKVLGFLSKSALQSLNFGCICDVEKAELCADEFCDIVVELGADNDFDLGLAALGTGATTQGYSARQAGFRVAMKARGKARGPRVQVAIYWERCACLGRAYKLVAITRSVGLIFLLAGTGGITN